MSVATLVPHRPLSASELEALRTRRRPFRSEEQFWPRWASRPWRGAHWEIWVWDADGKLVGQADGRFRWLARRRVRRAIARRGWTVTT